MQFEVTLAAFFITHRGEIATYGLEMREYLSGDGFILKPHQVLSDLDPETLDAFIVPGGEPDPILGNTILSDKLRELNEKGKLLAAICGGPIHLSQAGVLDGRRFTSTLYHDRRDDFLSGTYSDDNIVEDGNVITAWPNFNVDFAVC